MKWTAEQRSGLRKEIAEQLEETSKQDMTAPRPADIYVPASHAKALDFGVPVVVGMRGAGKTYWSAVLKDETTRRRVRNELPSSGLAKVTHCSVGFSADFNPNEHPGKRTLRELLERQHSPQDIWMAVVAWHVVSRHEMFAGESLARLDTWEERVRWVSTDAERTERLLYGADQQLAAAGRAHLILFDALDRTADDWDSLRRLSKGLLQVLLELRSQRAVRAKAFLRPDMAATAEIWAFPDASKLAASRVDLDWSRADLYGLLFQRLANLPNLGQRIREWLAPDGDWSFEDGLFRVPVALKQDEAQQQQAFSLLAGRYMGNSATKGISYKWLPNHLGDAAGRTSPRSFLAAVGHAAFQTDVRFPMHKMVLHHEAIKEGVSKASETRKTQLNEEFPWIGRVLQDLRGLTVPCEFKAIRNEWQRMKTLEDLRKNVAPTSETGAVLTPAGLDDGPSGIKADLLRVHVFQELEDGRINMPDIYRIAYGLGRKGGQKPVR